MCAVRGEERALSEELVLTSLSCVPKLKNVNAHLAASDWGRAVPLWGLKWRVRPVEHVGDDDITLALLGRLGRIRCGPGGADRVVDKVPDLAKDTDREGFEVEIERSVSLNMGRGLSVDVRLNSRWTYLGDAGGGGGNEQLNEGVEAGLVEGRDCL